MSNNDPRPYQTNLTSTTTVIVAATSLIGIFILAITFLLYENHDATPVIGMAGVTVPILVNQVIQMRTIERNSISTRNALKSVQNATKQIQEQVNGKMTAQFTAVHESINNITGNLPGDNASAPIDVHITNLDNPTGIEPVGE